MDTHDQPNIDAACGQSPDSADKLRTCSDCQNDLICHDQGECLRRKVSTINDGGPAFPCPVEFDPNNQLVSHGSFGMTLRDWFAGMALQGQAHRFGNPYDAREILAQDCYDIADAMLKAREVLP
jgi:hypothetical protein